MRDLKVLLSGASIAGPALAYWLNRYGCTVTVAENWVPPSRADSFHPQVHFRVTPPRPGRP